MSEREQEIRVSLHADKMLRKALDNKNKIMKKERLYNFLTDDLKKLEYHTNEIIENIYARGQKDNFKEDIEVIENFFSYWGRHINKIK